MLLITSGSFLKSHLPVVSQIVSTEKNPDAQSRPRWKKDRSPNYATIIISRSCPKSKIKIPGNVTKTCDTKSTTNTHNTHNTLNTPTLNTHTSYALTLLRSYSHCLTPLTVSQFFNVLHHKSPLPQPPRTSEKTRSKSKMACHFWHPDIRCPYHPEQA